MGIPRDFQPGNVAGVSMLSREKWNLRLIGYPNLESRHRYGLGVKIAILDTGYSPEDGLPIPAKVKAFGYKRTNDDNGHGTHVFGICSSIAPAASYYIYKVLGGDGLGVYSNVVKAIYEAIEDGVDIINMSLGGDKHEKDLEIAIEKAEKSGILVICASGNTGRNQILFPANQETVVAVGAVNRFKVLANFSTTGEQIDIVAPGVDIISNFPGGVMRASSGTSMAAPHVSGVAALIIDHYSESHKDEKPSPLRIRKVLYNNCIDLGFVGWDERFGNGLVMVQFHKRKRDAIATPPWYMKWALIAGAKILKWILEKKLSAA